MDLPGTQLLPEMRVDWRTHRTTLATQYSPVVFAAMMETM